MKRSKISEHPIVYALRQAEYGTPVADICRSLGIAEQTFYRWKQRFAGLGVADLHRLRQLEDENRKLKQLVADLSVCSTTGAVPDSMTKAGRSAEAAYTSCVIVPPKYHSSST